MIELTDGLAHKEEILPLFASYTRMLVELDPAFQLYLDIQHYEDEIKDLEKKYAPPLGRLHLLRVDGEAAGCVALRPLDEERCELKRLYILPRFRGQGLSHILMDRILSDAREIGYRTMLLDTLPELDSAIALYKIYGFEFTDCYNDSPVEKTLFMKKVL